MAAGGETSMFYSPPPSYEESIRGTRSQPQPQHPRSPSLQDVGFYRRSAAGGGGVLDLTAAGHSPAYSQTVQVDTASRLYGSGTRRLDPVRPQAQAEQLGPSTVPDQPQQSYVVYRTPAERFAGLEQVRGRPQSGELLQPQQPTSLEPPTLIDTAGQRGGRSWSPLVLVPTAGRPGTTIRGLPAAGGVAGGRSLVPITSLLPAAMTSSTPEMWGDQQQQQRSAVQRPTPMTSPDSNMSGILAFLDKTFMDKALCWQTQGPDELHESETYKLVREMDNEQRRSDGSQQ